MIIIKYKVREDYTPPKDKTTDEIEKLVDTALESVPYCYDKIEYFGGNPACGPFIYVTCDSLPAAEVAQHKIMDVFYKTETKRR